MCLPGFDECTSMHAIQSTPSPSYVPPVQWLPYRTRRISPTLASVLLQISGTGEQSQALLALTLEARVASLETPMREQRNSLRKRLAAAAAVEGLVQLVGAEVAAAVAALCERGRAQVTAVGPLPGVLAHVDDEGRPRCGHVFAHGAVAGVGARCHGNGGGTSHLYVAHLHLAHDFCGRKRESCQTVGSLMNCGLILAKGGGWSLEAFAQTWQEWVEVLSSEESQLSRSNLNITNPR